MTKASSVCVLLLCFFKLITHFSCLQNGDFDGYENRYCPKVNPCYALLKYDVRYRCIYDEACPEGYKCCREGCYVHLVCVLPVNKNGVVMTPPPTTTTAAASETVSTVAPTTIKEITTAEPDDSSGSGDDNEGSGDYTFMTREPSESSSTPILPTKQPTFAPTTREQIKTTPAGTTTGLDDSSESGSGENNYEGSGDFTFTTREPSISTSTPILSTKLPSTITETTEKPDDATGSGSYDFTFTTREPSKLTNTQRPTTITETVRTTITEATEKPDDSTESGSGDDLEGSGDFTFTTREPSKLNSAPFVPTNQPTTFTETTIVETTNKPDDSSGSGSSDVTFMTQEPAKLSSTPFLSTEQPTTITESTSAIPKTTEESDASESGSGEDDNEGSGGDFIFMTREPPKLSSTSFLPSKQSTAAPTTITAKIRTTILDTTERSRASTMVGNNDFTFITSTRFLPTKPTITTESRSSTPLISTQISTEQPAFVATTTEEKLENPSVPETSVTSTPFVSSLLSTEQPPVTSTDYEIDIDGQTETEKLDVSTTPKEEITHYGSGDGDDDDAEDNKQTEPRTIARMKTTSSPIVSTGRPSETSRYEPTEGNGNDLGKTTKSGQTVQVEDLSVITTQRVPNDFKELTSTVSAETENGSGNKYDGSETDYGITFRPTDPEIDIREFPSVTIRKKQLTTSSTNKFISTTMTEQTSFSKPTTAVSIEKTKEEVITTPFPPQKVTQSNLDINSGGSKSVDMERRVSTTNKYNEGEEGTQSYSSELPIPEKLEGSSVSTLNSSKKILDSLEEGSAEDEYDDDNFDNIGIN